MLKGNKKKRSRYIMEQHLGRELSIFEIVHHKDGDYTNDNVENLEVMSLEEHTSLHHAGRRKKR